MAAIPTTPPACSTPIFRQRSSTTTGIPTLPNGNNVVSLTINGVPVDFTDAATYYNVSTVNYLAAGSCNFNDAGVTLWPLNQIVHDTQYYVRDAVIDYIGFKGTVTRPSKDASASQTTTSISGTLGAAGAGGTVTYTGGSTTADAVTGDYSFWVPSGWSGTVTPGKPGISFRLPAGAIRTVIADMAGQDYAVLPPTVTGISPSSGPTAGGTLVTHNRHRLFRRH